MKNRCESCKFATRISARMSNWSFIGCIHEPYEGKWIAEIKECPKENKKKKARKNNDAKRISKTINQNYES